jgi:ABC-type glycerol-3-phosphate transport system substrate-binding protein
MRIRGKQLLLALLSAVVLAVVVAACGGGGSDTSGGSTGGGSTNGGAAGGASEEEVSGKITVWDNEYEAFPEYTKVAKELDAEFEKLHPEVTIDHVAEPFEGYEALLQAAFTSHEGPDVIQMLPGNFQTLHWAKGLEPLNDLISSETQKEMTGWKLVTPEYAEEGERFGVPIGIGGLVFYYNKKLFAKAGLPTTFEPKTWGEVMKAGEKLKAAGIQPFTGGDGGEASETTWLFSLGWSTVNTPEQATELSKGEIPFTDETVAKAIEPAIKMQEAGFYPDDRFSIPFFSEGGERFGKEEGAMAIGLRSVTAYYGEYNEALGEKNVGMFLPPGGYPLVEAEFAWTIPKFVANKDAAVAYVNFLASKQGVEALTNKAGLLPNRKDVSLPPKAPVQEKQLLEWSRQPQEYPYPHGQLPSAVGEEIGKEFAQVLQKRTSLSAAQASIQEAAEKALTE